MLEDKEKRYFYNHYHSCEYQLDTYSLFVERGFKLLREGGLLGFIIPSTFLTMHYFKKFRKFILDNFTIKHIIKFEFYVFEEATVETVIIILEKSKKSKNKIMSAIIKQEDDFFTTKFKKQETLQSFFNQGNYEFFINQSLEEVKILEQISTNSVTIKKISKITIGIKPYQTGKGKPKQTKKIVEERPFDSNFKKDNSYRQYVMGKDINRYFIYPKGRWIKYGPWLAEPRPTAPFDSEKILIRQTADRVIAVVDNSKFLTLNNIHNLEIINKSISYKYLLAILNSKLVNFFYKSIVPEVGRVFAEVKVVNLEKIPIKNISEIQQQPLIKLADRMLFLNKQLQEIGDKKTAKTAKLEEEIKKTDEEIDELVYKLYGITEEEKKIIEESLK